MESATSFDFQCPSCLAMLRIPEQFRGSHGKCTHCGAAINVPTPEKAHTAKPIAVLLDKSIRRRFWEAIATIAVPFVLLTAVAIIRRDDGSPLSQSAFALSFFLGTAFGASIGGLWIFPEKKPEWFAEMLPSWRGVLFLAAISVYSYFLSWLTYSL